MLYISVLLPSIFALYALYKNKITIPGIILAWILGIIITYCGGIFAFIALALTFVLTILSDKLKKDKEDEVRTIYQIISNVLTAALCMVLYYIKGSYIFAVMYYAVIAGSLGDTFASSFGSISHEKPRNPLTFKIMKKGESGAVSIVGICASLLAGFIIAAVYYTAYKNISNSLMIVLMGGVGSYFDSIMGAITQAKYECTVCHKQVEKPIHHKKKTKLLKGYVFMDNNTVNLLSNILVFILTYIILIVK